MPLAGILGFAGGMLGFQWASPYFEEVLDPLRPGLGGGGEDVSSYELLSKLLHLNRELADHVVGMQQEISQHFQTTHRILESQTRMLSKLMDYQILRHTLDYMDRRLKDADSARLACCTISTDELADEESFDRHMAKAYDHHIETLAYLFEDKGENLSEILRVVLATNGSHPGYNIFGVENIRRRLESFIDQAWWMQAWYYEHRGICSDDKLLGLIKKARQYHHTLSTIVEEILEEKFDPDVANMIMRMLRFFRNKSGLCGTFSDLCDNYYAGQQYEIQQTKKKDLYLADLKTRMRSQKEYLGDVVRNLPNADLAAEELGCQVFNSGKDTVYEMVDEEKNVQDFLERCKREPFWPNNRLDRFKMTDYARIVWRWRKERQSYFHTPHHKWFPTADHLDSLEEMVHYDDFDGWVGKLGVHKKWRGFAHG